ncbi:flocculation protein FLO11-like [Rhagoletis pomonella]|uniref:flocculation protein FLO11-like n=1 Tax=Rhagoletis pomonella TaxID=28610 RepID=UPI00177D5D1F|nr:flocculation protein FLO11-like [Rhagoletis pomonella]
MSENVQHCLTVYKNFILFLLISVEPKPLVTIGSSTDLDTESLDEINLNTTSDETQSATDTAGLNDPNANQLWSETNNQPSDSILTQAASSFSALPSVASSVLSTFSKRISEYSGSNSRERTPTSDSGTLASQLDIQPTYLQQQFPSPPQQQQQPSVQKQYPYYSNLQVNAPPTVGAAQPTGNPLLEASESHAASPPEPPKFYTPTEFTNLPTANVPPPPIPGGQNTYRLAAKKKLYAPIPGLSEQPSAPVAPAIDPLSSTAPFQGVPPLPTQTTSVTDPFGFPTQSQSQQEERKTGGLFANISNLVPSGVLQNISGLVQTAADTFTQGSNKQFTEEHSQQPYYGYSGAYQQLPLEVASAPAGQYFATSIVPPLPFAPQSHSALLEGNPSASELFAPIQLPPSQQSVSQGQAPTTQQTSNLFQQRPTPSLSQPAPPPPTSGFVAAPPKSVPPESSKQRPSASTTPISYFDPTKQTSSLGPLFAGAEQQEVNAAPLAATGKPFTPAVISPQENYPTTATAPCPLNEPLIQTKLLTPAEVVQQPFSTGLPFINQKGFGASNAAHLPLIPETSSKDATCPPQSTSTFLPPPTQQIVVGNQAPLPPTTGGSTSFRLQKGTRLYKSPLTSAETAPVHVQPDIVQSLVPPTSLFNPFGSSVAASVPHPLAPSATPTLVPSYFIAQPSESNVALFTVEKSVTEEKRATNDEQSQAGVTIEEQDTIRFTTAEPKTLHVATTAGEVANVESSISQSSTIKDIEATIQQQTIEAFLPEVCSTDNTETEKQTSTEAENQSEVLPEALRKLSIKLQPSEPRIHQHTFQTPKGEEKEEVLSHNLEQVQLPSTQNLPTQFEAQHLHAKEPNIDSNLVEQPELNVPTQTAQETQSNTLLLVQPQPDTQITPGVSPILPPRVPNISQLLNKNQNANPFRRNLGASPIVPGPQSQPQPQPKGETQPKLANFFVDAPGITGSSVTDSFNIITSPVEDQSLQPSAVEHQPPACSAENTQEPAIPTAAAAALPSAAGFFGYCEQTQSNFFQPTPTHQQLTEFPPLPPQLGIAPPTITREAQTTAVDITATPPLGVPPPIGFDNILPSTSLQSTQIEAQAVVAPSISNTNSTVTFAAIVTNVQTSSSTVSNTQTQQSGVVNSFTYFEKPSKHTTKSKQTQNEQRPEQIVPPTVALPSTVTSSTAHFFDTFTQSQSQPQSESVFNSLSTQQQQQQGEHQQHQQQHQTVAQSNEDQRLQNFFNNPPQRENNSGVGDLGYDLVHSGLAHRNLGSLTSVSNLVEPPSSSCSEFSEWNNSNVSARTLPSEVFAKRSPEKTLAAPITQQEVRVPAEFQPAVQEVPSEPIAVADSPLASAVANSDTDLAPEKHYEDLPEEVLRELRMASMLLGEKAAATVPPTTVPYSPAVKHWFYKRPTGSNKFVWTPFSHYDSALLETTLSMGANSPNIVAVEGGRYDVNIKERTKTAVYWECAPIEVRRCSWFYKGTDSKMVPYEESIADLLESEYKQAFDSGEWHKKIVLSMHEQVTFHGPTVIVHFQQQQSTDAWGGTSQTTTRPRVVKRDLDEFTIEQGESERVDHLLLMVHGIGSACDLKMRSVDEVVDDFRNIAQALVQSHYKNSTEMGLVGRVEVLPISWHSHLHSEEMGIDEKLRSITLESIPKLRNFTNDTLLDVLFYTSPKYCQKIMNTVAASMNEVYNKYRERHPEFNGGVSVAGHSLGSLILFDLLCHQKAPKETEEQNLENPDQLGTSPMDVSNDDLSVTSYTMGHAGTGQPFIHYPQLNFEPKKVFALGSPIGMFVTIRGIDKLGLDFRLPTCSGFYNIFHPFDPVAYRIEALVNPDLSNVRPVLIPHHKGRKRMHLELKETMTRVGADLKQRFLDTFKNTLESVNFLGGSTRTSRDAEENMSKEVDKVLSMQIEAEKQQQQAAVQPSLSSEPHAGSTQANTEPPRTRSDSVSTSQSDSDLVEIDFPLGKLNDSKRIDYVLQEAPLEFINEYIFAMGAHVCYWESEDTILFVMKEIYTGLGISPDSQVPQQTMTIERPSSQNSNTLSPINEKR